MSVSFWTMFCVVYGGVLFLSLKRGAFALVLGFLSGLGVAFFCLRYLPGVFTSQAFYALAAGVLCGVALGTVAENADCRVRSFSGWERCSGGAAAVWFPWMC